MDNSDTILYSIPDFYNYYQLNMVLLRLINDHPGYFRDNIKIDSCYGTFPGCIWNSGRTQFGMAPYENIISTIAGFNQLGISVRFTFTNKLLEGHHFLDTYGNAILAAANNGMNGVNVSVGAFAEYIEKNYPKLYVMWSTTKGLKSVDEVNELSEKRMVVPPYTMNNTSACMEFAHPENIELLTCETCINNCPDRSSHYEDLATAQLIRPSKGFKCPHGCEMYYFYETVPTRKHHITPEDIEEKYLPLGINKFKISGRNDNIINVIERYVYYFAKPEYKDHVRNHLLIDQLFPR